MKEQILKKRERRSLASREGYRWLQYGVQHNHIFTAQNQPRKHITKIYTSILRVTADVHLFEVKAKSFPHLLKALPKEKTNKRNQTTKSQQTHRCFSYISIAVPQLEWPKRAENVHDMQVTALKFIPTTALQEFWKLPSCSKSQLHPILKKISPAKQ